jgi:hypothetical protein
VARARSALYVNGELVPVAEEWLWRGVVQPRFCRAFGAGAGMAVTAVLFSVKRAIVDASLGRLLAMIAAVIVLGHAGCSSSSSTSSCTAKSECPSGQLCLFEVGSCYAQGHCLAPDTLGPMCNLVVTYCGCDGSTVGGLCGPPYALGPTEGKLGGCGGQ